MNHRHVSNFWNTTSVLVPLTMLIKIQHLYFYMTKTVNYRVNKKSYYTMSATAVKPFQQQKANYAASLLIIAGLSEKVPHFVKLTASILIADATWTMKTPAIIYIIRDRGEAPHCISCYEENCFSSIPPAYKPNVFWLAVFHKQVWTTGGWVLCAYRRSRVPYMTFSGIFLIRMIDITESNKQSLGAEHSLVRWNYTYDNLII